jgi:hypothetical protein
LYSEATQIPIAAATKTGGAMNCHTDTPADRATTSSSFRDRLRNEIIAPNKHGEGQRLLGDDRGMQQRQPRHQRRDRAGRVAGAAQRFNHVDYVNQHNTPTKTAAIVLKKRQAK